MKRMDQDQHRRIDRRTFLKGGLVAGGLLAAAGAAIADSAEDAGGSGPRPSLAAAGPPPPASARGASERPNILVIVVDQMRFPQWLTGAPASLALTPNIRRLSEGAVSFTRHYTASNDCTPARATLLTGLYTHQTGCMITGGSTLDPAFPTWGATLREHGYHTWWYGKWHLTHHDNYWGPTWGRRELEHYGFSGGTYPSPDGAPGQGWHVDPHVGHQFADWFAAEGGAEPWCTTISFVNPHDIAWWYAFSDRVPAESTAARVVHRLPPNYETPELLIERNKPRLQRSLQDTAASSFGPVPFTGPEAPRRWMAFLDLYAKLQGEVDRHVGQVLQTLQSRPEVAANTVVLFTSDHGEYGASHGLRGKGAGVYEEGIRVPLIVKDPRGMLTGAPEVPRRQLSSSVDVAALLLTIATGSNAWRAEPRYSHLADRLDLAAILADPQAPGRPYVIHATDEAVTEFAIEPYAADAPLHVVAVRTPAAKYATYSHWPDGTTAPLSAGQERELYDYRTHSGRLELHNSAGESPQQAELEQTLEEAVRHELRRPLPAHLSAAQARGFADYFNTAAHAAVSAAGARRRILEHDFGELNHTGRAPGSPSRLRL